METCAGEKTDNDEAVEKTGVEVWMEIGVGRRADGVGCECA